MPDFILRIVVSFLVRQITKFGRDTDWNKVKADLDVRIRKLIPGTWFDDEAAELAGVIIDAVAEALKSEDNWVKLLTLVAQQKWNEALDLLIQWVKDEAGL